MRRIKVVSEPTDLVPVLRAFDSPVKRDVFRKLVEGWETTGSIETQFGPEGVEALHFFEKTKLVETKWQAVEGRTQKAYHSYYTSFHINAQCGVEEMAEILTVAAMPEPEFHALEEEIYHLTGKEGGSSRLITEKLGIPLMRLKGVLKRSSRLEIRGHIVRRLE